MTKPKLLLLAGLGWCATSPLWRTLKETDIIYSGYYKEPDTLYWLQNRDENPSFFDNVLNVKYKDLWNKNSRFRDTHPENLFSKDVTLNDFVDYYKRLYDSAERGSRKYVCDFSNRNADLTPEFISEISTILKDNFDVRVMMIVRNPVRRSYSFTSAMYRTQPFENSGMKDKLWDNKDAESRKKWQERIEKFPDSISYWRHLVGQDNKNLARFSYVEVYKKWAAHFPMLPIVMEDLWGGNVEPLENFLECKVGAENLFLNCYYPEMGTKAPRHPKLKDQWMSDMQDLTENDLAFGKQHLQYVYDEWYDEFKTRPWE